MCRVVDLGKGHIAVVLEGGTDVAAFTQIIEVRGHVSIRETEKLLELPEGGLSLSEKMWDKLDDIFVREFKEPEKI